MLTLLLAAAAWATEPSRTPWEGRAFEPTLGVQTSADPRLKMRPGVTGDAVVRLGRGQLHVTGTWNYLGPDPLRPAAKQLNTEPDMSAEIWSARAGAGWWPLHLPLAFPIEVGGGVEAGVYGMAPALEPLVPCRAAQCVIAFGPPTASFGGGPFLGTRLYVNDGLVLRGRLRAVSAITQGDVRSTLYAEVAIAPRFNF
jgi:hypothetical protein